MATGQLFIFGERRRTNPGGGTEIGDHRQKRAAQAVADYHDPVGRSVSPGRADMVRRELFDQARAGEAGDDG
jgi:hypothetical protein